MLNESIFMGYTLTIPDQKLADVAAQEASGGDGQGDLINGLARTPLARAELKLVKHADAAHLSRFNGTDYCQWYGRCADGYYRGFGRIMQIVKVNTA